MIYEYMCDECETISTLEKSMSEDIPKSIECDNCKCKAMRIWGNMSINIPEYMRADSSLHGGDSASNSDYLKQRMNHGTRPSGKGKVVY